mmetsp:Transcript_39483/g.84239  ORF Transcript_39483/g.84239 Transcript_39483/m.84239 type:complete len:231 (-) Transcript_39483:589-1281(-)
MARSSTRRSSKSEVVKSRGPPRLPSSAAGGTSAQKPISVQAIDLTNGSEASSSAMRRSTIEHSHSPPSPLDPPIFFAIAVSLSQRRQFGVVALEVRLLALPPLPAPLLAAFRSRMYSESIFFARARQRLASSQRASFVKGANLSSSILPPTLPEPTSTSMSSSMSTTAAAPAGCWRGLDIHECRCCCCCCCSLRSSKKRGLSCPSKSPSQHISKAFWGPSVRRTSFPSSL